MKKNIDMCSGSLAPKILLFTIPVMLTNLLQLFYNTADVVILGNFGSKLSVGAVGATATIITLIVNTFMGLSVGVNVTVAEAIGSGNRTETEKAVHTSAALGIICGILAGIIGFVFSPTLLSIMNTPEHLMPMAVTYIKLYFLAAPANLLYNFLAAVLRAKGETKIPLYILAGAGLLKIISTIILAGVLNFDIVGAASATIISQVASAVAILIYMTKRTDDIRLTISKIKLFKDKTVQIIKLGVPSGIQGSVFALSAMVIQSAVNFFGEAMVTGNSTASSIDTLSYSIHNAFSYTAISFVAQNRGANKIDRVKKSIRLCLIMGMSAAIISGLVVFVFGENLLNLYIPGQNEAIAYGLIRLKYICIPYFLLAAMDAMSGALRGLGYSTVPAIISLAGACGLRICWIYTVFEHFKTPDTLFLAFPVTWGATFLALFVYYLTIRKKQLK